MSKIVIWMETEKWIYEIVKTFVKYGYLAVNWNYTLNTPKLGRDK